MELQTVYPFRLPKGYLDGEGTLHREGRMRLATAGDELSALRDPRVKADESRLNALILSRVVTMLGTLEEVTPEVVEGLFISDMEFDRCTENAGMTNFDYAKKAFAAKGYALPQVVFWNVCSRNRQQPVTRNQQGAALLSGCTPWLFEMALSGVLDPYGYMMRTLDTPRYRDLGA